MDGNVVVDNDKVGVIKWRLPQYDDPKAIEGHLSGSEEAIRELFRVSMDTHAATLLTAALDPANYLKLLPWILQQQQELVDTVVALRGTKIH